MRSERGQATVEWTGLLLLVAVVLVGASHLASRADGRELGTTLAQSVTQVHQQAHGPVKSHLDSAPPRQVLATFPAPLRRAAPGVLRRAGRGAGAVWRKAWFACLVYERSRYSLRHPESRLPGYTLPYGVALRMINNCVSPVDLLRDLPALDPGP